MNKLYFNDKRWEAVVADIGNWQVFHRKRYQVRIQKALPDKVYNVPGKPGVVYNFLEDCEESTAKADYIVTGLLGEMWPISEKSLNGYVAGKEEIEEEPKVFYTRVSDRVYYGLRIPAEVLFFVETSKYGTLKGNSNPGRIPHDDGDYIICTSFEEGDYRIVNGRIFLSMYEQTGETCIQ